MVTNADLPEAEFIDTRVDREIAVLPRAAVEVRRATATRRERNRFAFITGLAEIEGAAVGVVAVVMRLAAAATDVQGASTFGCALPEVAFISGRATRHGKFALALSRGAAAEDLAVEAAP